MCVFLLLSADYLTTYSLLPFTAYFRTFIIVSFFNWQKDYLAGKNKILGLWRSLQSSRPVWKKGGWAFFLISYWWHRTFDTYGLALEWMNLIWLAFTPIRAQGPFYGSKCREIRLFSSKYWKKCHIRPCKLATYSILLKCLPGLPTSKLPNLHISKEYSDLSWRTHKCKVV